MVSSKLKELFTTKLSLAIFILYILLFVNQGLLVTASQNTDNSYDYNIVTTVLFTEILKLILSTCIYLKSHTVKSYGNEILKNKKLLLLYFVPALLYCVYNNLSFTNLSSFDPTTYYLLLQFRVVVTGILFQIIFGKHLTKAQWVSLIVLTVGCMLKQLKFNPDTETKESSKSTSLVLDIHTLFLLVQILCSCLAGVYNEYLLKEQGADVDIYMQNVFMYLDSIICNVFFLPFVGNFSNAFAFDSIKKIIHPKVLVVILNNACIGIVTSFFLKTLNSILKTFASALELILTAILSWIFFGIPIYLNTFLSICTVFFAIYLYSRNPVSNIPSTSQQDIRKKPLLAEEV
ncbi:hypothetical protein WA026_019151 [Henosepilachna vigintioctopunctata]|uniref:Uncharacterized protein n=1 Tax=Henosepilachna vigintioctopunctata TaxID=420089 RepID=A0AAW1UUS2_9CUCU